MFYKYFLEIKNRVVLIFNSWILTMVTCYFYKNILLFLLIKLNSNLYKLKSFYFITTNFTDIFSVCLQIGSFISIQCLILLSVYHFITFITPGLFKFEYKLLKLIIVVCCLLFCISIIFFHLFFLPFLCDFFLRSNVDLSNRRTSNN